MVEISKGYLESVSARTNFHRDTLEKLYRLVDLLKDFNEHPILKEAIILKGGTAINFSYFDYPRLSVDLDFNFIGGISKIEKDEKKPKVRRALGDIFKFKKYRVIEDTRNYALDTYFLAFTNSVGNTDRIKVEVNYLSRIPILDAEKRNFSHPFSENKLKVNTLKAEELFAGKFVALLDRGAARDLYDIYNLIKTNLQLNEALMKKLFIFFGCLIRTDFRSLSPDSIGHIGDNEIKRTLLPLLRKNEKITVQDLTDVVMPYLSKLFFFQDEEKEYITNFFSASFTPALLFKDSVLEERAAKHPMVEWKLRHITEHLSKH